MARPGLIQRLVERFLPGAQLGTPGAETWTPAYEWSHGVFPSAEVERLDDPYSQHPVIGAAISIIAEDAACVPLELVRGDTDEVVEDHPLWELLNHRAANMSGTEIWRNSYSWALMCGEFFWYYPNARIGSMNGPMSLRINPDAELKVLDPRMVRHKISESGMVSFGLAKSAASSMHEVMPLDADRLTQWKRFNPNSPYRGLPLLDALKADLDGDHAAAQWNRRFFGEQNGIPTGVLIPGPQTYLSSDQLADMRRTWNQKYGRKRTVAILPPGADFKQLGSSQREMDFKTLREYARELALGALGLPPFIAGVLDKANYANARKQEEVYWQGTIKRFVKSIQNTLNTDFLPKLGVEDVRFRAKWQVVNQTLEDFGDKVEIATKMWDRGVPWAVINERLELGLDVSAIPGADTAYAPLNFVPQDSLDGFSFDTPGSDESGAEMDGERVYRATVADAGGEVRRAMVWRAIAGHTRDLEAGFDKDFRRFVHRLNQEALRNLPQFIGRKAAGDIDGLVDIADANKRLETLAEKHHTRAIRRGKKSVETELGAAVAFDVSDPVAQEILSDLTGKIVTVNATMLGKVAEALMDGVERGLTEEELGELISQKFGATLGRSRIIARTETAHAFNAGRHGSMLSAGITENEWLTSRDADVRPATPYDKGDHARLDGERVPVGRPFSNGLLYPSDPAGPPEEVINCRCVSLAVT